MWQNILCFLLNKLSLSKYVINSKYVLKGENVIIKWQMFYKQMLTLSSEQYLNVGSDQNIISKFPHPVDLFKYPVWKFTKSELKILYSKSSAIV